MDFNITLVGLNHRTASVDIRERFALANFCSPENWAVPCRDGLRESLILSTCNRVELLAVGGGDATKRLLGLWAASCNSQVSDLDGHTYFYRNLEAVKHIFEVASSLDSMVLGEPQILGQLKAAYRNAVKAKCAGSILNRLMHKSFSVAKRVRNETAVAASAVSISYAAVELAKRIFDSIPSHKAMLVGAGEMAELAAMHLTQAGIDEIYVLNRTLSHGEELAKRFNGHCLPFEELASSLADVDIVISSTGSPETVIHVKDIKTALKKRKNRPMFFIDIAVPRDIDPEVNTLDNVYLYDIDDLKEVVEENRSSRKEEAVKAHVIVDDEVRDFAHWLENIKVQPEILQLIGRGEAAANAELAKTLKKLGPISPEHKKALEIMAHAIVRKLNHAPLMYLKDDSSPGQEDIASRMDIVRKIFNLDSRGREKK